MAVERRFNLLGTATLPEELGWGNGDGTDDSAAAGPADSADLAPLTQTYIERSWQMRFYLTSEDAEAGKATAQDPSSSFRDTYVYLHLNGLCILGLAATHAGVASALRAPARSVSVTFDDKYSTDRCFQFEGGKKARRKNRVQPDTKVCSLTVADETYSIRSGVNGQLLEINNRLAEDPMLLIEKPASEGWLAVIQLASKRQIDEIKEETLSLGEYMERRAGPLRTLL